MDDREQERELTDDQITTVMPGATQVMQAQERDRDGTDGDAKDGTDGDAKDADGTDSHDADDAQDADGTDSPSTS